MARQLLLDSFNGYRVIGNPVCESVTLPSGLKTETYKVTGVFQNFKVKNENRRVYPKGVWDKVFCESSNFMRRLKARAVHGMLEHPEDGVTRGHLVSHVITEVRYATPQEIMSGRGLEEGDILGSYEVIPGTPHGDILLAFHKAKVHIGVSSRGLGSVNESNGALIVFEDDFDLDTWDAVTNPSVVRAIPKLVESVQNLDGKDGWSVWVNGCNIFKGTRDQCEGIYESFPPVGKIELTSDLNENVRERVAVAETTTSFSIPTTPAKVGKPDDEEEEEEKAKKEKAAESATPTTPTHMSKLADLKKLKAEAFRLLQTETKNLKPSDKAALFDSIDDFHVQVGQILTEDASLSIMAADLTERLRSFAKRLDEEGEDDLPPPPAPEDDAPPPADLPEEPVEGDPVADEVMQRAVDFMRANCADDPEAQTIADELEDLCVSCNADTEVDAEVTDVEMPMESKKAVKQLYRAYRVLESQHKRLSTLSQQLVDKHGRVLKESRKAGAPADIKELKEYKEAAVQLAEKYNKDMVEFSLMYLAKVRPDLHEAHKDRLSRKATWESFSATVAKLVSAKPLKETKEAPKAAPKTEPTPSKTPAGQAESLKEDASEHFALRTIRNLRR